MPETNVAVKTSGPGRPAWPLVLVCLGLALLSYFPILRKLVSLWFSDEDMAHGVFVPLVAGYAAWQNRARLAAVPSGIFPLGLAACGVAAVMRVVSSLSGEVLAGRLALLLTIFGVIYLFTGPQGLRQLRFPLLILLFAIPIPRLIYSNLTLSLQMVASSLSENMLEGLGYTVLRQGNILQLPGQTLSVAEACSGIRSLFSISFLVVSYLYFHENRGRASWVVLALTVPVAIVTNAVRIVFTGIAGEYDPAFAEGLFHATAGWVLSLAGFALLMAIHAVAVRIMNHRPKPNLAEAH